jgi:hypothetical protein
MEDKGTVERLTYFFQGEFNLENTNELLGILNSDGEELGLDLFIQSSGGEMSCLNVILHALNNRTNVKIYPTIECSSAAFLLLLNSEHPVVLKDTTTVCTVHLPRVFASVDSKGFSKESKVFLNAFKYCNYTKQLLELDIPKSKLRDLQKGKDVELYYEDYVNLFKKDE